MSEQHKCMGNKPAPWADINHRSGLRGQGSNTGMQLPSVQFLVGGRLRVP